jgi:hypothetical protein
VKRCRYADLILRRQIGYRSDNTPRQHHRPHHHQPLRLDPCILQHQLPKHNAPSCRASRLAGNPHRRKPRPHFPRRKQAHPRRSTKIRRSRHIPKPKGTFSPTLNSLLNLTRSKISTTRPTPPKRPRAPSSPSSTLPTPQNKPSPPPR